MLKSRQCRLRNCLLEGGALSPAEMSGRPLTPRHPPPTPRHNTEVDIREDPDCFMIVADVPGLKPKDCCVRIENDRVLILSGERTRDELRERPESKYIQKERKVGRFFRKFTLPDAIDNTLIAASCQDGVLTVLVPKAAPPDPHKPWYQDIKVGSYTLLSRPCEPEERREDKKPVNGEPAQAPPPPPPPSPPPPSPPEIINPPSP